MTTLTGQLTRRVNTDGVKISAEILARNAHARKGEAGARGRGEGVVPQTNAHAQKVGELQYLWPRKRKNLFYLGCFLYIATDTKRLAADMTVIL